VFDGAAPSIAGALTLVEELHLWGRGSRNYIPSCPCSRRWMMGCSYWIGVVCCVLVKVDGVFFLIISVCLWVFWSLFVRVIFFLLNIMVFKSPAFHGFPK